MISDLVIADIPANTFSDISELITKVEPSWSMDGASQVRFTVLDKELKLLENRYFPVRRTVTYGGSEFEIAVLEISQSEGKEPLLTVDARNKPVQRMKRDKSPSTYGGVSATDYARIIANRFGLTFVGEPTAKRKAVIQKSTGKNADSVWSVLQRSASEAEFVCFEAGGTLYFASQKWLLGKWGNHPMVFPSADTDPFIFLEVPQCRRSEDSPLTAEFKGVLARANATSLRPGMTVVLSGMHEFNGSYLITEITYEEGVGDPVGIAARTAEDRET